MIEVAFSADLAELLARELAEALAGLVVWAHLPVVRIARIGGDFFCNGTKLVHDGLLVPWIAEQRLDPGLRPVVLRYVVVHEELPEQDPDPDVGERPKREDSVRRRDELVDLGVRRLQGADDRADRLVDQWDPELFLLTH